MQRSESLRCAGSSRHRPMLKRRPGSCASAAKRRRRSCFRAKRHVAPRDCAGWWRRFAAAGIDAVVVIAIITSFGGSVAPAAHQPDTNVSVTPGNVNVSAPGSEPLRSAERSTPSRRAIRQSPSPSSKWLGKTRRSRFWEETASTAPSTRYLSYRVGQIDHPSRLPLLVPGLSRAARCFRRSDFRNDDCRFARGNDRLSQAECRADDFALRYRVLALVADRSAEFGLATDPVTRSLDATRVVKVERVIARATVPVQVMGSAGT